MTTYRIHTPSVCYAVIEQSGITMQAAPRFKHFVGRSFAELREYSTSSGWIVEPVPDDLQRVQRFTYRGDEYELVWSRGRLIRITLHSEGEPPRDITANELPAALHSYL